MSMSPEPPERLAEILMAILALSTSTGTSQSESACGNDPVELFDAHSVNEQSQQTVEGDNDSYGTTVNVRSFPSPPS